MKDRSEDSIAMLKALYARPGFLLRRAHQISVAIFSEEIGDLGVTSTQFGALYVIRCVDGLDQIGLARLLGMDRSTSALVVTKLEAAGWIIRQADERDRRRKVLVLTAAGRELLTQVSGPAQRSRDRLLSPFTPEESRLFLALVGKFVDTFNSDIRTPIIPLGL